MIRKIIILVLVIANIGSLCAQSYEGEYDDYIFTMENGTARIIDYEGDAAELNIPKNVRYKGEIYRVTSIGDDAFRECNSLVSVTIPDSVVV